MHSPPRIKRATLRATTTSQTRRDATTQQLSRKLATRCNDMRRQCDVDGRATHRSRQKEGRDEGRESERRAGRAEGRSGVLAAHFGHEARNQRKSWEEHRSSGPGPISAVAAPRRPRSRSSTGGLPLALELPCFVGAQRVARSGSPPRPGQHATFPPLFSDTSAVSRSAGRPVPYSLVRDWTRMHRSAAANPSRRRNLHSWCLSS
jgi:hypothetical protein